jgi:hypothetical protein
MAAVYLKRYLKTLDKRQMQTLLSGPGTNNPLFLKIVLSEMRLFGSYETLDSQLAGFGNNAESAFEAVLRNIEQDAQQLGFEEERMRTLFSLLAMSNGGLTIREWESISAVPRDRIRMLLRRIDSFVSYDKKADGRTINFAYQSFRAAAVGLYRDMLSESARKLYGYYEALYEDPARDTDRLCSLRELENLFFHAFQIGGAEALAGDPAYINERVLRSGVSRLIRDLQLCEGAGAKANAALLATNAEGLLRWPESWPGILALEAKTPADSMKHRALFRNQTYLEPLAVKLPASAESGESEEHFELLKMRHFDRVVAMDTVPAQRLVFRVEKLGTVSIYNMDNPDVQTDRFEIGRGRVLALSASHEANAFAVFYEDGHIISYAVHIEEGRVLWIDKVWEGVYRLPETEPPASCWDAEGRLLFQGESGTMMRLTSDGESIPFSKDSQHPTDGELSWIAREGLFAVRKEEGSYLLRDKERFNFGFAVVCACETDSGIVVSTVDGSLALLRDGPAADAVVPVVPLAEGFRAKALCAFQNTVYAVLDGTAAAERLLSIELTKKEVRNIPGAEAIFPKGLILTFIRLDALANGELLALTNIDCALFSIGGNVGTDSTVAFVFSHKEDVYSVIETDREFRLIKNGAFVNRIEREGRNVRWIASGEAAIGFSRDLAPVLILSPKDAVRIEPPAALLSAADGGWLLGETNDLYQLAGDSFRRFSLSNLPVSMQSVQRFSDKLCLAGIDTRNEKGMRVFIYRVVGQDLRFEKELFFAAANGHYQTGAPGGEAYYAILSDGAKEYRLAKAALSGVGIAEEAKALDRVGAVKATAFTDSALFLLDDNTLHAFSYDGNRFCSMRPAQRVERIFPAADGCFVCVAERGLFKVSVSEAEKKRGPKGI